MSTDGLTCKELNFQRLTIRKSKYLLDVTFLKRFGSSKKNAVAKASQWAFDRHRAGR